MSLKGAKDNMGQHKVAFTIQELLKLLDESAAKLNASSKPSMQSRRVPARRPAEVQADKEKWVAG